MLQFLWENFSPHFAHVQCSARSGPDPTSVHKSKSVWKQEKPLNTVQGILAFFLFLDTFRIQGILLSFLFLGLMFLGRDYDPKP